MATEEAEFLSFAVYIRRVYPPVLFAVGLCGNILFVLVLFREKIRKISISLLLGCLALSDTAVLTYCVLKTWIATIMKVDLVTRSSSFCKIDTFLTYFLLQLSPWILVLATVERTYSILYPLKVKTVFTKRRLLGAVVLLASILACVNAYILFSMDIERDGVIGQLTCKINKTFAKFFFEVWPWIDMCMVFIIPSSVLLVGNVIIFVQLKSSQRFWEGHLTDTSENVRSLMRQRSSRHIASFTRATISINLCFIICQLPATAFGIGQPYWYPMPLPITKYGQLALVSIICYMLMYTYNALNFILYMLCCSNMRNELLNMFRCRHLRRTRAARTRSVALQ